MAAADAIAKALGGRKAGIGWIARCPAHDDRNPSLSLSTGRGGKVLLRCHAGCDQAQVIDALRARGIWEHRGRRCGRPRAARADHPKNAPSERDETDRIEYALRIWRVAVPASNTLAETYLQSRGLCLPLSSTLRFHGGLKHPSGGIWPAMVALVMRGSDDAPQAIHRTFLTRDGSGKAPVDPQKMMLGPCRARSGPAYDAHRPVDGGRRDRDLPRGHAGDGKPRLGGTVHLRVWNGVQC